MSLSIKFDWKFWYQYDGKGSLITSMSILQPQGNHTLICGMLKKFGLFFICAFVHGLLYDLHVVSQCVFIQHFQTLLIRRKSFTKVADRENRFREVKAAVASWEIIMPLVRLAANLGRRPLCSYYYYYYYYYYYQCYYYYY